VLAWLLSLFGQTGAPVTVLLRPVLVLLPATWLVQIAVTRVLRSTSIGALVSTMIIASLAALWIIALPLAGLCAWWTLANFLRVRRGSRPIPSEFLASRGRELSVVTLVLALLVSTTTWSSGAVWLPQRNAGGAAAGGLGPNIYVLLLDGYPRADALESRFGIDNSSFVAALEERGFGVAAASRTNYSMTWLTLASVFQMAYVQDMPELRGVGPEGGDQYRVLGRLMNSGHSLDLLHEAGYQIVSSPTAYPEIALTNADLPMDPVGLTRFETILLEKTIIGTLGGDATRSWLAEQERSAVRTALLRVSTLAATPADQPHFAFVHVFSPHPPFVFTANGDGKSLPSCFPSTCSLNAPSLERLSMAREEYAAALGEQIAFLNRAVLETVDAVTSHDPNAVIVLFGDHATRYDVMEDSQEALLAFFAARTPGMGDLFGEAPYPVGMLPTLFNAYLGLDIPIPPYQGWVSYNDRPLDLVPVE
jgi:hypothetical protein